MPSGRVKTPGVWLLDLEIGGHVYRFATNEVDVMDAAGRTYLYREGLSEPSVSYGSVVGLADVSVTVEVVSDVDWPLVVQSGHALDRCPAVLRRWFDGRTLERCRVVLRGLTSAPAYGAVGEPFSISIVRSMREQTRTWPPVNAVVDETTWPVTGGGWVSPESAQGLAYPVVIGFPGHGSGDPIAVVPVPQAEHPAAATGGRLVWLGGDAAQVRVRQVNEGYYTAAVSTIDDLLGRTVQSAIFDEDFVDDGKYFIGFSDDPSWGGGILYEGEVLRGVGDVITWVLREFYTGPVDWGRVDVVRPWLNQFKIDTWIDVVTNMWTWLSSEVLPLLPVEMREGPQGIYPALLRFDLTERDAVAHLDATADAARVERAGPVSLLSDVVNEITLEFQPMDSAVWRTFRVLTSMEEVARDPDINNRKVPSFICSQSQQRYGVVPHSIKAGAVWDSTTAVLTVQHVAARRAWPRRTVRYTGEAWLEEIEIGQAVTLTDPELRIDRAVALVADVTPTGAGTAVDLILLDHPARQS